MGRGVFRTLPFAARLQPQPRKERAEPRLLSANAPTPFRRPAEPGPNILTATRDNLPTITPLIDASDRRRPVAAAKDASSPRYLVIAGCIVFAIAGIAGASFLLLTAPRPESVATAWPPHGSAGTGGPAVQPPPPGNAGVPAPPNAATARPTATAAIPVPVATPHLPAAAAAPKPPGALAKLPATPAVTKPILPPVVMPAKPAHPAVPAREVADRRAAMPPAVAQNRRSAIPSVKTSNDHDAPRPPSEAARDHRVGYPAMETHHHAHTHLAEKRPHPRSERETHLLQPKTGPAHSALSPPPEQAARSSQPGSPQSPDQNAAFDQLLAHLTGSANAAARAPNQSSKSFSTQPLTPPAAGAPDPFAPRQSDGSSDQ